MRRDVGAVFASGKLLHDVTLADTPGPVDEDGLPTLLLLLPREELIVYLSSHIAPFSSIAPIVYYTFLKTVAALLLHYFRLKAVFYCKSPARRGRG